MLRGSDYFSLSHFFLTFGLALFAAGFVAFLAARFLLFAALGHLAAGFFFGLAGCHGSATCAGGVGAHLALALAYALGISAGAFGQFAFLLALGLLGASGGVLAFGGGGVVVAAGAHDKCKSGGYDKGKDGFFHNWFIGL